MAKNDNKNFSLPTIKDLEIYFDLIKEKDISELEIETDQIRIKIVSENKNIKFSTQQTASEIRNTGRCWRRGRSVRDRIRDGRGK